MRNLFVLSALAAATAFAPAVGAQTSIPNNATEQMIGEEIRRQGDTCRELQLSVRRSATEELLGYDVRCLDRDPSQPGETSIPDNATEQQLDQ